MVRPKHELLIIFLVTTLVGCSPDAPAPKDPPSTTRHVIASQFEWPVMFEKNDGQAAKNVAAAIRNPAYAALFTSDEVQFRIAFQDKEKTPQDRLQPPGRLQLAHFSMHFQGASKERSIIPGEFTPTRVNDYHGRDEKRWRTDIKTFSSLDYKQVYPGIDLRFYGRDSKLYYSFRVSSEANHQAIEMDFPGTKELEIDPSGRLIMKFEGGRLIHSAPRFFQIFEGRRQRLKGTLFVSIGTERLCGINTYSRSSLNRSE